MKNIVLCSDGTGNKGGSTPDTNVFRIYNAIKINSGENETEQITYYDNGVGTSKISIMQALGGGMGVGFRQNVRDLYEFLGRNYSEGDDIYIFGFSRGAATVRAFAGMIEHCGLIVKHRGTPEEISEEPFQELIDAAMHAYKQGTLQKDRDGRVIESDYSTADAFRKEHAYKHEAHAREGKLTIEFMGIWDTVSALGVPQLGTIDTIVDVFFPHKFYDLEPKHCVKNVYHAIAVDDERRTFRPLVWDEKRFKGGGTIEQVWFPGMHSNVGGGYNRQELATVSLDWMMEKVLVDHKNSQPRNGGLTLKNVAVERARRDANPFGKLHDSRSGFGISYRYQPRPIEYLCEHRLNGKINIHNTVIKRMKYRTGGYAPLNIPSPRDFNVTFTRKKDSLRQSSPKEEAEYTSIRAKIDSFKNKRITLYWVFLVSVIAVVGAAFIKWLPEIPLKRTAVKMDQELIASALNWGLGQIADVLHYVLPDLFSNVITYGVTNNPEWFAGLLGYSLILYTRRVYLRRNMEGLQEEARIKLLSLMKPPK